ncbi:porin [uncultured Methylobacterium sp.]|uniref:porin n=1 Tax=uncultured Methylobacterium sp. TaxID=157278 RepID=UPI0035CC5ECB
MRPRIVSALTLTGVLTASPCPARELAQQPVARVDLPCPGHGAGFVRVPGSPTCIRLSGRVAAGADLRAGRDGTVAVPMTVGRFAIDARTDSDLGPVRTFVRIGNGRR